MADNKPKLVKNENNQPEKPTRIVKFKKPVDFEGETYTEIDLIGLEELTGRDLKELDRLYISKGGRRADTKEMSPLYTQLVAARATGLPLEFFDVMSFQDATMLEVVIRNFLMSWG